MAGSLLLIPGRALLAPRPWTSLRRPNFAFLGSFSGPKSVRGSPPPRWRAWSGAAWPCGPSRTSAPHPSRRSGVLDPGPLLVLWFPFKDG